MMPRKGKKKKMERRRGEEEGGSVDAETTVKGEDDELIAGLAFLALILAAALSTAAHKLSAEFSRPLSCPSEIFHDSGKLNH
jgi:hypothetical protein